MLNASTENVAFISERLHQQMQDVECIYYRHNASVGATIIEIIDNYIAIGLQSPDAEQSDDVKEQAWKYSWVPQEYISGVFDICQTRKYAIDLVGLLGDHFEKPAYLKYGVSYSTVASIPRPPTPSDGNVTSPKARTTSKPAPRLPVYTAQKRAGPQPSPFHNASATSRDLAVVRDHSFSSAALAFRKGKSNPLYRQAGAYYVERGKEQARTHREAVSAEAEDMVDQRSTTSMIDLHGVTVQDGVEIAKDRVSRWWESLGEDRARKAKEGFTVVTGIGRHSADGRSRLRSNVVKALVADGWKIEVLTGSYLITGRR